MDIKYFAMHYYNCDESEVTYYWGPQGKWVSKTKNILNGYGGINWDQYFHERPFWITETNCDSSGNNPTQE